MDIHFCDLCNESIPQTDLDQGRARSIKGRAVCFRCESAMHVVHGEDDGELTVLAEALGQPAAPPAALHGAPPAALHGALHGTTHGTGHAALHGAHHGESGTPHAHAAPGGGEHVRTATPAGGGRAGVVGIGLAVVGIALAVGVGAFGADRIGRHADHHALVDLEQRAATIGMQTSLAAVAQQLEALGTRIDALDADLRGARERTDAALRAERERTSREDAVLQAHVVELDKRGESLDRLRDDIRALASVVGRVESTVKGQGDAAAQLVERVTALESRPASASVPPPSAEVDWAPVVARLKSATPGERYSAVDELGSLAARGQVEVIPHLVPMLRDVDLFVRMAAARILGEVKAVQAVSGLIDALEDPEGPMREAALSALRMLTGRDFGYDPLAAEPERARKVKAWRDWWRKAGEEFLGPAG